MLNDVHSGLLRLISERGGIDLTEVDVKFEIPSDDWVNSLIRPTVSLFLFEVEENTEKRETNMQVTRGGTKAERRMPPRRIDLFYMASALAGDIEDEHALLWRLLAVLLKYQQLPRELFPASLEAVDTPITTRLAGRTESRPLLDVWNALGTKPHPALCYIVTVPLELDIAFNVPVVFTRTARYRRPQGLGPGKSEMNIEIGGVVRNRKGEPVADVTVRLGTSGLGSRTDNAGRYVLNRVPEGPATLRVVRGETIQKEVRFHVPADSYDIVLD